MGKRKHQQGQTVIQDGSGSRRTHTFLIQVGRDHKGRKNITFRLPRPKWLPHAPRFIKQTAHFLFKTRFRFALVIIIAFLLAADIIPTLQPYLTAHTYALGSSSGLLPKADESLAKLLTYDAKNKVYNYNQNYTPQAEGQSEVGGAKIIATADSDPTKGITVTDPFTNISMTISPKFRVLEPQKQDNRLVYPLADGTGWLVYTMGAGSVKEDILLDHANGDTMSLSYDLHLGDTLSASIVSGGNLAIFGNSMLSGQVSTGSDKDKTLLEKARKNAKKDKLLFIIPAPIVKEDNRTKSVVKSHYVLKGSELTLVTSGLKSANYPLSIDPSVYVNSIAQFMLGNNESNINFDTTNNYIEKGFLTGALLNSSGWQTNAMPLQNPAGAGAQSLQTTWGAGYAVGDGFMYVVGGTSGSTVLAKTKWAQISNTNHAIVTPLFNAAASSNSCYYGNNKANSSWCSNTSYDLPFALANLSAVVYNGYLYAIGGTDGLGTNTGCTSGNKVCSNVYVAKLSANGEPISWTSTSSLIKGRMFSGAVAYNNKLYVVGGQTSSSLNGEATIEYADVKPDGTLSSWTASSSTSNGSLSTGLWGETLLQYNGYLYAVGGAQTTTAQTSVQYTKINSDGTLPSWQTTSTFTNARMAFGGQFATVYNGYMYITSGCTTLTTTSCTTLTSPVFNSSTQVDFQYASINADGTVSSWVNEINSSGGTPLYDSGGSNALTGYGLLSWAGSLYAVGGCTAVSTATSCGGTSQSQVKYGVINTDGYISQIFGSPSSDFFVTGSTPIPDSPAQGTGANKIGAFGGGAVINNGYLYMIGGCATNACNTSSGAQNGNTAYIQLNSDGTTGSSWTVDSTHTLSTTGTGAGVGLVGFGIAVYDNVIYIVAGNNGTNDQNQIKYNPLNNDGSLSGNWQNSSYTFTTRMHYSFAFARSNPASSTTFFLYSVGGCIGTSLGCSSYVTSANSVFKCTATIGGGVSTCTTSGQLQLAGSQYSELALFAGIVYGNYIYLVGGANTAHATSQYIQYAMLDSSGNIVKPTGTTGANWEFAATTLDTGTSAGGGTNTALSGANAARRRTFGYAANGYLYVFGGYSSGTVGLSDMQYAKIDIDTGNISSNFTIMTTTMTARWEDRIAGANGYAYILGGCAKGTAPTCTANVPVNEYVQVYNNYSASPLSYTTASNNMGTDYIGGRAALYNGKLYYAGGCTNIGCSAFTNTVKYGTLDATGNIPSSWTSVNSMNSNRAWFGLYAYNGYMYAVGGQTASSTHVCTTEHASISGTGSLGTWTADTAIGSTSGTTTCTTGNERSDFGATMFNGYIYVVGGRNNAGTLQTTVYYALLGSGSIGTWATTTAFTTARTGLVAVAYGQTLYILGGIDGSSHYLMDVQYANITSTGTVGTWNYGTSLPQPVNRADGFAANGFLFIFGGRSASTNCTTNTYTAPINGYAAGSTSRNGIGAWSQTVVSFADARYGASAVYSSGKAYLLGGGCSALVGTGTGTTANRVVYGTLQVQPQVASYSLALDFGEDVDPSKYLVNGVDNGIGARWILNYLASTDAANCWGGASGDSTISLGSPTSFPLSTDSCSDASFDRYYFLFLTVDASQAFGFPEDYTRGPNIQNLTLQYISNPSKRLRNGKTFTNGIQQPLNAPF